MTDKPVKLFMCDLNHSMTPRLGSKGYQGVASAPQDWAFVNPKEYFDWHMEFGNNVMYCQAYTHGGYAFYPTRLGPVAPGPGQELLPRLFELSRSAGVPFYSYFDTSVDLIMSNFRNHWVIPGSRDYAHYGFLAPESPWTDLLCARISEFLSAYPVDWMVFDWFVYGNLKPDEAQVQPAWFVEKPFRDIIGRDMPDKASEITPEENLAYKREILARQFYQIRDTIRKVSPTTKIMFNVPYWKPDEALWVNHPMVNESDGLVAECSRDDVMEWLLKVRKPNQRVLTTIIGRQDEGQCDANSWQKWYARGCDFQGYAWGTPPDFRPHPIYQQELEIVRRAFAEIG